MRLTDPPAKTRLASAVAGILDGLGLPLEDPAGTLRFTGDDPVVPSSFRIGTAAAVALAASATMAAALHRLRGGPPQTVEVDLAHAVTECRSERYLRVDGGPAPELWDPLAGIYACGDGGFVRLHTNFPHHRDGILRLLSCAPDREAVAAAMLAWPAAGFEAAATAAGLPVAAMRSFPEWDATEQGRATARQPLIGLRRAGAAGHRRLPIGSRPLSGIRVVEMTRIIAGPVCGRALAGHGAEVLRLIGPSVPTITALDMDTGHGKRSAWIDLADPAGCDRLHELLATADVFVQSYRPGSLDRHGFGPDETLARHPHLVYASLSAYGPEGPWATRRGFDSLVQTATGFNHAEARAFGAQEPRALPAQILDHASGHLLALGVMAALARRMAEGGAWRVDVSLARVGHWLRSLGPVPDGVTAADRAAEAAPGFLEEVSSGYGRLSRVRPAARLSKTPIRFSLPSSPYGADEAAWQRAGG